MRHNPGTLHQAEALADRFPALLVTAERVAATISMGVHGRRHSGIGETFWQYRHYVPGDPSGTVDWRRSASGDAWFVREKEWEAAQGVWLWADTGPSMGYRSRRALPTKRERAALLVSALACLLIRGGERIAALASDEPLKSGRIALLRLAHQLENTTATDDELPLHSGISRHGAIVMAGDFLQPVEAVAAAIEAYAGRGIRGHLVHILDPAEETFPFAGRIRFQAIDTKEAVLIGRAEDVQDDYRQAMARHRRGLEQAAREAGWSFITHRTDQPPHSCLLSLFTRMAR